MRPKLLTRLRAERGFTTVVVMGMLLVGMLLVAAAFAASDNDTVVARHDQYYKEAYNAAEAGVNWYYFHLTQDANFWSNCTTGPVNLAGTSWGAESKNTIPGSEAQYAVELLPPAGSTYTQCVTGQGTSVIDPTSGTFQIRSTGNYRSVRRTIIATFKRTSFLNFIWFTDYETNDPVVPRANLTPSQVSTQCTVHDWPSPRSSNCSDPYFISGDSLAGPVRSNDEFQFCGNPTFGRSGKNDKLQSAAPTFYRSCGGTTSNPTLNSAPQVNQTNLVMPPSNATLKTHADCIYTGPTHITLNGSTVTVKNNGATSTCNVVNGVIYVQNATCSTDFATSETYPANDGCGDAWVHSTGSGAGRDLTIAADNDVIVDGSIIRQSGTNAAIGLIANNFVRMYHPALDSSGNCIGNYTPSSGEDAGVGPVSNPEIDAAILSLKHSWIVDSWDCGNPLGTLKVLGAIAQEYRGTVGTFNQGSGTVTTGYLKGYTYDDQLRYHDPPFFLDPVQAGWDVQTETEQVPTH